MTRSKALRIRAAFVEAEEEFPDKSTAFLAAIVADRNGIEHGDVFDALEMTAPGGQASCADV